jgi:hypothetical protein
MTLSKNEGIFNYKTVSRITGLEASRDRVYFALEMSWFEQADQFWTLGQTRFEAGSMAKPGLPFSLLCLNRQATRIYCALSDTIAAEATWHPFDGYRFKLGILRLAADYTRLLPG